MPYDNGAMILGITWMEMALAVIAVAIRFYARIRITKNVGVEDWTMLLAVLLQLLGQSILTVMVYWGLGRHMDTLSIDQRIEYTKWSCLFEIPGVLSTSIARTSIAILLWRLFGVKAWFRRFLYLMTALQTAAALALLIVWGAQCRPINALWGPTPQLYCWDPIVELTLASVFQSICTVIDFTYVLFPIVIIWHLSLRTKVKLCLIAVLSFGLLAMVASIIKTIENQKILSQPDPSYDLTNVAIWLTTEQNLVIIVGCVPVWRSLFTRTSNGSKKLAFGSLLSKYFPHGREMQRNSASDLEALRQPNANEGAAGAERNGNVETRNASRENGVEIPPMPRDQIEVARKDSIELPSLDLIGKPTKPTGSL